MLKNVKWNVFSNFHFKHPFQTSTPFLTYISNSHFKLPFQTSISIFHSILNFLTFWTSILNFTTLAIQMFLSNVSLQGPLKLPFVGSLPYFYKRNSLIHNIKNMVEEHGPISGFFMGSKKVVVIADLDMLKGFLWICYMSTCQVCSLYFLILCTFECWKVFFR